MALQRISPQPGGRRQGRCVVWRLQPCFLSRGRVSAEFPQEAELLLRAFFCRVRKCKNSKARPMPFSATACKLWCYSSANHRHAILWGFYFPPVLIFKSLVFCSLTSALDLCDLLLSRMPRFPSLVFPCNLFLPSLSPIVSILLRLSWALYTYWPLVRTLDTFIDYSYQYFPKRFNITVKH